MCVVRGQCGRQTPAPKPYASLPPFGENRPQPSRLNPRPYAGFSMLPFGSHRPAARLTGENPMALERTLSIIKPDAVAKNVVGEIYSRFETAGLKVAAAKMKHLSRKEAEGFYAVHRERSEEHTSELQSLKR